MKLRALILAAAALSVPISTVAASGPQKGGTLIAADPNASIDCVNAWFICEGSGAAIVTDVIEGAFKVGPDLTYRPNLVSHVSITESPFTVTYFIRPEARWSDGVPVTARDFLFTFQALTSKRNGATGAQALYAPVRRIRILGAKTFRVLFGSRDAAWRDLFHEVFPEHALVGEDLTQVWKQGIDNPKTGEPIGDGPFLVSSVVPGDHLTVIRNPRYWGAHKAYLDSIVFKPVTDSVDAIDRLRQGQVDVIDPQIEPQLVELRRLSGITILSRAGTSFEHLEFRLGPGGSGLLRRLFVRQAIAYGIDRNDLVRRLFSAIDASLSPMQSLLFFSGQKSYVPHWRVYRHDPARARRLLESNGCQRGADGIYVCAGERLSLRFATTAGNPTRELTFSILHEQLQKAGIELVPVFAHPAVFFGQILNPGRFDIAMFTYINPPDPGTNVEIWRCGGSQNRAGYCNRQVSHDLLDSDRTLDPVARAALLDKADALLAKDLPAIPLFEKPAFVAFKNTLHGVVVNDTGEGWLWNAGDWWLAH